MTIYKHYKGGYYELLHIAQNVDTGEDLVVYKPLFTDDGRIWVRSAQEFFGSLPDSPLATPRRRFQPITDKDLP